MPNAECLALLMGDDPPQEIETRNLLYRPSYVIAPNNDRARRPPSHHGLSDDAYVLIYALGLPEAVANPPRPRLPNLLPKGDEDDPRG